MGGPGPEGWRPVVPFDRGFDAQYGLDLVSYDVAGEGVVRGRIEVTESLLGLAGSVHSGVFAAIAESLASTGTALAVVPEGHMALGISNDTSVLEPVSSGTLHATARVVSRSEDAWVWTVDTRDGEGRPCSLSRVTVAVRSA